jgi:hypothetical protein
MHGPLLVIRNAQMIALREALARPAFEATMAAQLRKSHPDRFGSSTPQDLLALIRRVVDRGRRAGIDDFAGWGVLLELAVQFGEDFWETQEWVRPPAAASAWSDATLRADLLVGAAAAFLDAEQVRADAVEPAAPPVNEGEEVAVDEPDPADEELDEDFNNDDLSDYMNEPKDAGS